MNAAERLVRTPLSKKEQARTNRQICDSRAAAWHNILIVLVKCLGCDVVVQKPSKLRPKTVLPRVPCTKISRSGVVFYDLHENRASFDREVNSGVTPVGAIKDFHIQEKSRAFNAALDIVTRASTTYGDVRVCFSQYNQPMETEKKRREAKPRIDLIYFGGIVFDKENIIAYGSCVYAWSCNMFKNERKEVDLELMPFPIELWYPRIPTLDTQPDHQSHGEDQRTCDETGSVSTVKTTNNSSHGSADSDK